MKKQLAVLLALVFAFSLFAPLSAVASTAAASTHEDACCDGHESEIQRLYPCDHENQYNRWSTSYETTSSLHRLKTKWEPFCPDCYKYLSPPFYTYGSYESHSPGFWYDDGHGTGNNHHAHNFCSVCSYSTDMVYRCYGNPCVIINSTPILVEF